MSASAEFTQYILDELASVGKIHTASMFGGKVLRVRDKQLGVIFGDTLYFKVTDPDLQQHFTDNGSFQFSYTRKDKSEPIIIKHWWSVPDHAIDDNEQLIALANQILKQ